MPVLAVAIADVLVRDLNPAIALGLRDHPLDEAAVLLLHVSAARQLRLSFPNPNEQRVADALELGGAQDAGAADGSHGPVDALPREGRSPQLRELLFEAGDLTAKLVANGAVIGCDQEVKRDASPGASGSRLVQVVIELGHTATSLHATHA